MAHRQRAGDGLVLRQKVNSGVAELVRDPERARAWTLVVNGTPQSHVDLDNPEYLGFEYMRRLGHVADLAAAPGLPVRALHLGAGGLTLARYVAATRPGSRQVAADVDAAEMIRDRLPCRARPSPARGWLRVRIADARRVLEKAPPASFGLVIADVFAAGRRPAQLTSAELAAAAARALDVGGLFAANIADGMELAYTRAQAATACAVAVFPEVCVIADPGVPRGRRFGNLTLVAGRGALPVAALTRRAAADPFPGRVVHGAGLDGFIEDAKPVTDADAKPSPSAPSGLSAG